MTNKENLILEKIDTTLKEVKNKSPLTCCITNFVTVNDCANAVLAIGASPIMTNENKEIGEIVNISDALVINIGTLTSSQIETMLKGAHQASKMETPIILDPVGVGVSEFRNDTTKKLITDYKIASIRGNISEIKAIAKLFGFIDEANIAKGVDVSDNDIITSENLKVNSKIVEITADRLNTLIIASGPIDILSNGKTTVAIKGGDEMMSRITGSGCMLTSIIGSCIGATNPFDGGLLGILAMNRAGEIAKSKVEDNNLGSGSFRTFLIDALYNIDSKDLIKTSKIEIL